MQRYQFERIYSQMEKEFGKIRKGDEEGYAILLFPLESNALKVHRENPKSNSRRLREAIALALFDIKGRYEGEEYDLDAFRDEDNGRLEQALLMAFDPFTNEEIREIVDGTQMNSDELRQYYREPVICLLKIKDSIDTWEKRMGADGYFNFIEGYMGSEIKGSEMNFSILKPVQ